MPVIHRCLIICEDDRITRSLEELLTGEGFQPRSVRDGAAGLAEIRTAPADLVITGMIMPGLRGDDIIRGIRQLAPRQVIWVITEERNFNVDFVVQAMKLGADDYFVILDGLPMEKIRRSLQAFKEKHQLIREFWRMEKQIQAEPGSSLLLGECPSIQNIRSLIARVAPASVPVLITGESGTGKEVVARAIWQGGERHRRAFVAINCGAIPEALLESELYGYVRGAFTGAGRERTGRLEQAHQGTVFLDEIGEMPAAQQAKLLRFLQEGEIQPVGGNQTVKVDVRVLAATSRRLPEDLQAGRFREDLYYRLNVIHIQLPPLRERGDDVLLLASHFLNQLAGQEKRPVTGFTGRALAALREYHWPGNIRELRHRIHRAVILSAGPELDSAGLGFERPGESVPLREALARCERKQIEDAMSRSGGNLSQAAKSLGIARQQLQRLVKKYGLQPAAGSGNVMVKETAGPAAGVQAPVI